MFQTKRWNEAIGMTNLKAQSPSLAITVRVLFGRGGVSFAGQSPLPFCGAAGSFPALAQTQAAL
jgi:hypothetical protein